MVLSLFKVHLKMVPKKMNQKMEDVVYGSCLKRNYKNNIFLCTEN